LQTLGPVGGTKDERGKTMARDLQLKRRLHRALSASPGWLAPLVLLLSVAAVSIAAAAEGNANSAMVERWGVFELALNGPSGGNPFVDAPISYDLPGDRPYKVDGIDTWEMTVTPIGSAEPGKFDYTPPKKDYAVRLTAYKAGENIREAGQQEVIR